MDFFVSSFTVLLCLWSNFQTAARIFHIFFVLQLVLNQRRATSEHKSHCLTETERKNLVVTTDNREEPMKQKLAVRKKLNHHFSDNNGLFSF